VLKENVRKEKKYVRPKRKESEQYIRPKRKESEQSNYGHWYCIRLLFLYKLMLFMMNDMRWIIAEHIAAPQLRSVLPLEKSLFFWNMKNTK
jgi:hypothetical protein